MAGAGNSVEVRISGDLRGVMVMAKLGSYRGRKTRRHLSRCSVTDHFLLTDEQERTMCCCCMGRSRYALHSGGYILRDYGALTSVERCEPGQWLGVFRSDAAAIQAIKAQMDQERFWPDAWRVDQYGGMHLIDV